MNGHRPSLHTDLSNDLFQVVGPYDLSHLAIEVFPVQEPPPSPTVSMAVLRRRLGRCCEVRSDSQLLFLTMGFFPQSRLSPSSFDCDCKNPLYTRSNCQLPLQEPVAAALQRGKKAQVWKKKIPPCKGNVLQSVENTQDAPFWPINNLRFRDQEVCESLWFDRKLIYQEGMMKYIFL